MKVRAARLATGIALLGSSLAVAAPAGSIFERVVGLATKTGFRGVVAWQAETPVAGVVEWGTSPTTLDHTAAPFADIVDTAQIAVFDGLERGSTVYYRVLDRLSGTTSPVSSFVAANAYTDWSLDDRAYTIDLLIQLDAPSLDAETPDTSLEEIAAAINITAERFYDALDGFARVGTVLITDTVLNNPVNVPYQPPVCADVVGMSVGGTGAADVLVETTIPFDSHVWLDWTVDDHCSSVYPGRLGRSIEPWQSDLHMGYIAAHELLHYTMNARDLYGLPGNGNCVNLGWDGSIMSIDGGYSGGRWRLTELDRNQELTPCDHGVQPWAWDVLRERYREIPPATAPDNAVQTAPRGHPDGGALQILLLHQLSGGSTLETFTPSDAPADGVVQIP